MSNTEINSVPLAEYYAHLLAVHIWVMSQMSCRASMVPSVLVAAQCADAWQLLECGGVSDHSR